jgi:hypothetical protein
MKKKWICFGCDPIEVGGLKIQGDRAKHRTWEPCIVTNGVPQAPVSCCYQGVADDCEMNCKWEKCNEPA